MTVAAVVLAAGASSRYGRPKQRELLPSVLTALGRASIARVIVVSGAHELDLREQGVELVHAEEWERGPGASLRRGLAVLGPDVTHALVVLADGPELDPRAIERIIQMREPAPVVAASYDGVRSHPVLLARSVWADVPDDGGRSFTPTLVDCSDLRAPGDVDYAPLDVAVAQPPLMARDVAANAEEHAAAVRRAGARVVVFPELSLTGYELDAAPLSAGDARLETIVAACVEASSVVFAGAPVGQHIATLRIDTSGVEVAYAKSFLGGDETRRFRPGEGPRVVELDGWRIGLGICKDTGVQAHIDAVAALDVDLYLAGLVHRPDELAEQYRRGERIAAATRGYVAFASCAAATGGGYDTTAGHSAIWDPDGSLLADAGADVGGIARATLVRS